MTTNRPNAISTKQLENDRVIVTERRFAAGAETGWHRHGYDYIVVPNLDGSLLLESKTVGKSLVEQNTAELKHGQSYVKSAGVEHNVINANEYEFSFVEIELK